MKMPVRALLSRLGAGLLLCFGLLLAVGWTAPSSPPTRPGAAYARANAASRTWELRHGHWFDGQRFRDQTWYVRRGLLQRHRPAHVDTVVDLRGQWVVPPFAEAHTHMLDGPRGLSKMVQRYLLDGVFYVQVLTNSQTGAQQARPFLNQPRSVDAVYANGGLTSTLGHPFTAYEPRALGLYDYAQWAPNHDRIAKSRLLEHDAYWFFDSPVDVAAQWPRFLAGHPDVVKIYLLHANQYAALHGNGQFGDKGLRPDVARDLVQRAHRAGLRVWAHIETAEDFRLGLRLGVDGFAHAANYNGSACPDPADCFLTAADLRAAGRQGVVLTPTIWVADQYFTPADSGRWRALQNAQRRLLQDLVRYGVRPLVGTDRWGETPVGEALAWEKLGAFDHATLLRLWCETTARAIFPGRKIGRLAPGYEASLLVLGQDPLGDFPAAVRAIRWRMKQGELLAVPAEDK